ncbi:MAG: hypothetical protein HQM11_07605 [SAR324 cluster bacterium]|nr:hypothetical protein [SAR324 cluster bacterium]
MPIIKKVSDHRFSKEMSGDEQTSPALSTFQSQIDNVKNALGLDVGDDVVIPTGRNLEVVDTVKFNTITEKVPGSGIAIGSSFTPNKRDENIAVYQVPNSPDDDVVVTADYVTVYNASGLALVLSSVNELMDSSAVAGANSIDTGDFANGWYYMHVIYGTSGTSCVASKSKKTFGGLNDGSAVNSGIAMPSGYTFGRQVGTAFYCQGNASDVIIRQFVHQQEGDSTSGLWEPDLSDIGGGFNSSLALDGLGKFIRVGGSINFSAKYFASNVSGGSGVNGFNFILPTPCDYPGSSPAYTALIGVIQMIPATTNNNPQGTGRVVATDVNRGQTVAYYAYSDGYHIQVTGTYKVNTNY